MSIYNEWGFQNNPFETMPLLADDNGELLLVGREDDLKKIIARIDTPPNIVTIEGENGIGKTSLINVAVYKMYKDYLIGNRNNLYIPCIKSFQLTPEKDVDEFIDEVLLGIAQTLIKKAELLKDKGYKLESNRMINNWINAPIIKNISTNMMAFGFGTGFEANTTSGFEKSGFRTKILNWLEKIFPNNENGGIVCTIDNIELLQTSEQARKQLEQLRDTLFSYTGIRWVLSGSQGIVLGAIASPRLEGRLFNPIEIKGIDKNFAHEILQSRIKANEMDTEVYMPIRVENFKHLYSVLNYNIRNTLNYVNNYCMWIYDKDLSPQKEDDKEYYYNEWIKELSNKKIEAVGQQIRPRAIKTFKAIVESGGTISPGDYEKLEFNSIQAMRPQISDLESVGLVVSSKDDKDKRRKSIEVTAEGWFYSYGCNLLINKID